MAYEKYLVEAISALVSADQAQALLDSPGWQLIEDLAEKLEASSTADFLRGDNTPEQHRADLTAIRMLIDPIKIAATGAPKWRKKVAELEKYRGKRLPRTVQRR